MKKIFALLLALMLFLAGCANGDADQAEGTTTETTPQGYYEENSQLEIQTDGALRQYILPDNGYRWVKSIGDRLLLASDTDPVQLRLLSGDTCVPLATAQLNGDLLNSSEALFNGFFYYDTERHAVLCLDQQLQQTQETLLPADATNPVISQDGSQVFYCVGQEIRALDITRKISRLVKTQNVAKQTLIGTCFEGKILICSVEIGEGETNTLYISTETGQTLKAGDSIHALHTYENSYLLERMDGTVLQRITGTLDGNAKQLNIEDTYLASALELGGAIGYGTDDNSLYLNFYNLSTGKRTAALSLPATIRPHAFLADRWSGYVWLLVSNSSDNSMQLLRWDLKASAVEDQTQYVGTLYTVDAPDTASMDALNDRISTLNKKYGVRIRIWKDAVKSPGGYTLVPEHQISAISGLLDQLQTVLAEFPKNFVSKSISSKVRICLVRSVDGQAKGVQYWDGSNAFIALSTGVDVRSEFLKAFGYVIDSHVLGNSPKYDYWDSLNPSSFMYGGTINESLVSGEDRVFVDVDSMSSGTIDRSRVFWQAMLPENADMFKSETMQKKLTMLCKAIRDAWNLEKSTDIYPWEQYLTKPIAKRK